MTRNTWIGLAVVAVAIVVGALVVQNAMRPPPAVEINTGGTKVSIGAGGVSISVAPSSE